MRITTAERRLGWPAVLALSLLLQGVALLVFLSVDRLRTTRLTAEEKDLLAVDEEARERFRRDQEERETQRADQPLDPEEAKELMDRDREDTRETLKETVRELAQVREDIAEAEKLLMEALAERTPADLGQHLFTLLHPLATQLTARAWDQAEGLGLPETPAVVEAARAFERRVRTDRDRLLTPEVFTNLTAAHEVTRQAQHRVILSLDDAQAGYADDEDRIRRENHIEYLVNLNRDRISRLLREHQPLDPATMNELPDTYQPPDPLPDTWEDQVAQMSPEELLTEAERHYRDLATLFEGARAADLALANPVTAEEAFAAVEAPTPPPSPQGGPPTGTPGTLGAWREARDQLAASAGHARDLAEQASVLGAAARTMAGLPSPGGQGEGRGSPGGGGQPGRPGSGAGSAMAAGGRYVDMTPFLGRGGGEQGYGGAPGAGRDRTDLSRRSGYREQGAAGESQAAPPRLAEDRVIAQALPGRRFDADSPRTGWLFIDTWYVIGPWDNQGRITFEQPRPPETLVDLDAEYPGKDGRTLAWRFHQSDNLRVKPPDETESATYFAYTEVYFDEATDLLVAVASDDAARVWLNDTLIWEDRGLSPWRIDEGFRRVRFDRGFNTLLVRIENGPITCTWSVLLCPPEALPSG